MMAEETSFDPIRKSSRTDLIRNSPRLHNHQATAKPTQDLCRPFSLLPLVARKVAEDDRKKRDGLSCDRE